jgi:hypothetical protein
MKTIDIVGRGQALLCVVKDVFVMGSKTDQKSSYGLEYH